MNLVESALRRVVDDVTILGLRYALVGGLAVSVHAEPRSTRDVDLAIAVEGDADAERATRSLIDRGYQLLSLIDHEVSGRLASARLRSPAPGGVGIDLLFASSGIEPEIVGRAELLEILPGLLAVVATPGDLVVLKLLARETGRAHDSTDLAELARVIEPSDVAIAHEAVRLIVARGFNRDRDLVSLLDEYLAAPPPEERTH